MMSTVSFAATCEEVPRALALSIGASYSLATATNKQPNTTQLPEPSDHNLTMNK